jgi:spore photoproduct lyase
VTRRIDAMRRLADHGWPVAVRFDPLILSRDFEARYQRLFAEVFAAVPGGRMHSVCLGAFRLPASYWQRALRLHPDSPLFAAQVQTRNGVVSYPREQETAALAWCHSRLRRYVEKDRIFSLSPEPASAG